jgi:hypothetical protein
MWDHGRAATGSSPYTATIAARYCAHFGAAGGSDVDRPELVSRVGITGLVRGLSSRQTQELRAALEDAFKGSPFFDASSPRTASGQLSGQHGVSFSAVARTVEAPWTETVDVPGVITTVTDPPRYQPAFNSGQKHSIGVAPIIQPPRTTTVVQPGVSLERAASESRPSR